MAEDITKDFRLRRAYQAFQEEWKNWTVESFSSVHVAHDLKRKFKAENVPAILAEVPVTQEFERRDFSTADNAKTFVFLHCLRKALEAAR